MNLSLPSWWIDAVNKEPVIELIILIMILAGIWWWMRLEEYESER